MAVETGVEALNTLRTLLDVGHDDRPFAMQRLRDGLTSEGPDGWLWERATKRCGLRDPEAYRELERAHRDLPAILHQPPAVALACKTPDSAGNVLYTKVQEAYLRRSIDVTMKGGIASGVIYPLALCELARGFRLRNVGGASAGAIAAAFAAAAELGRARLSSHDASVMATADFHRTDEHRQGRCRSGFTGLADVIAWLTQLDPPNTSTKTRNGQTPQRVEEQFRTAQLFKPTRVTLPIFRLMAAMMRKRFWALPILAAISFGRRMTVVSVGFVLLLPLLLCLAAWFGSGAPPISWASAYLVALGWLTALSIAVFGLVIAAAGILLRATARKRSKERRKLPQPLQPPIPEPKAFAATSPMPYVGLSLVGWAGLATTSGLSLSWAWLGVSRSVLAWLLGSVAVAAMMLGSIANLLRRAKLHRFGLIGGATIPNDQKRLNRPLQRALGMPRVTVSENITDWIDQRLTDLAAQENRYGQHSGRPARAEPSVDARVAAAASVVRFGDLWSDTYRSTDDAKKRHKEVGNAPQDPQHRRVNLELMTSELVHRVPRRFPLDPDEELYFRRSDLEPIFPTRVLDALCIEGPEPQKPYCVDTGQEIGELHRLPKPWDLPVVFAVRISMSFPGLFEAIRLYRTTANPPATLRDDFGAPIIDAERAQPLTYPGPDPEKRMWMQELWFSDGGIASNFPIHFFDSVLPRWPTVGINLSAHPTGFGHQDVYLPSDRQATKGVPTPMGDNMLSLLGSIFDTARNWRDTAQTLMVASRGRIAWVRQRSYEGGLNLFMPRDTVATLALRGAVAGARLRRRFSSDAQWQRHQWLRFRVAMGNLANLCDRIQQALRETRYAAMSSGVANGSRAIRETVESLADQADPNPPGPDPFATSARPSVNGDLEGFQWYPPRNPDDFWTATHRVLAQYSAATPNVPLTQDAPTPAAALRQVPPI